MAPSRFKRHGDSEITECAVVVGMHGCIHVWRCRLRVRLNLSRHRRPRGDSAVFACRLVIALSLLVPIAARASEYYVDRSSPNCSSSGPGTEAQPYCTITAAVAAHNGPGVTILVKPGVYREQVTIPTSGSAGSPFVLKALEGRVVVDGSDDLSDPQLWVHYTDDVYLAPSVGWNPLQVFLDGKRLTPSGASPALLPEDSFRWILGEGLYVNGDDLVPGTVETLVGRRSYGFSMFGKAWITIEDFTVAHTESRGIYVNSGSSDVVVSRDTVSFSNVYGIQVVNGQRVVVESCRSSDNNFHGIGLTAGTNASTVRFNESTRNVDPSVRRANGIFLFSAPGNTVHGNRVHDNQDSGLHLGDGSHNCLLYNNRSWNNGDHGYDHLNVNGTVHINEVAFGNFKDGFSIEADSPNSRLYNCVAIENGLTTNEFNLWVNTPSSVGFVSDYNIFWNSTTQQPIKIGTTLYPTLAAYQAATGLDAHSHQLNPGFVDGAAGDFRLVPGSPAIDAGTSGVTGWPVLDAEGRVRVDDPATANAGAGPVLFPDRGALEFVTDQGPVVVVPDEATVVENDSVTIAVKAMDPDGDGIEGLTVAWLPPGAVFVADPGDTTGVLRWTPTSGQAGHYTLTFVATGAFTGSDSTVITVTAPTAGVWNPATGSPLRPRVAPNPARDRARLTFVTMQEGPLRVQVFDLAGRAVRTLIDEAHAPAGDYDLGVDVGSRSSAPLAPGLYFYRIQSPGGAARGRFMVLR